MFSINYHFLVAARSSSPEDIVCCLTIQQHIVQWWRVAIWGQKSSCDRMYWSSFASTKPARNTTPSIPPPIVMQATIFMQRLVQQVTICGLSPVILLCLNFIQTLFTEQGVTPHPELTPPLLVTHVSAFVLLFLPEPFSGNFDVRKIQG